LARRVVVRADRRIGDDEQLLLRMNNDSDVVNALKLALANAPAYRVVPGFEQSGALTVSCFAVVDEIEAQIVVRGTRWSWYGLTRVGDLSDRHVDVIVCPYPPGTGDYATLTKTGRSSLRASLEDRFTVVLRAFDPRRTIGDGAGQVP